METIYRHLEIYKIQSSIPSLKLPCMVISDGTLSPAGAYMEDPIDLNELMLKTPDDTFLVIMPDDSMTDAFIPFEGWLVVDRCINATYGDIIVAVVYNKFTVKRLLKTQSGDVLSSAKCMYNPIEVIKEMNFQVWGVVSTTIITPQKCVNT